MRFQQSHIHKFKSQLSLSHVHAVIVEDHAAVLKVTQQTGEVGPMLVNHWSTVYGAGPTETQHLVNFSC